MTTSSAAGVTLVTPVYRNHETLPELAARVATTLGDRAWRLRFVIDASPDSSAAVAHRLAATDARIGVTDLAVNVGQNRALVRGLAAETETSWWVCLDADLQDPPEAVPQLLDRLAAGDVDAVFAGRRGNYESRLRLLTGRLHRSVLNRLSRVPADAGAFVAFNQNVRDTLVRLNPPSIVAGIGAGRVRATSVPVERLPRPSGRSAWTASSRARQSGRAIGWVARQRLGDISQRWTTTSA